MANGTAATQTQLAMTHILKTPPTQVPKRGRGTSPMESEPPTPTPNTRYTYVSNLI